MEKVKCKRCGKEIAKKDSYNVRYKGYAMNDLGGITEQTISVKLCSDCNDKLKAFLDGKELR